MKYIPRNSGLTPQQRLAAFDIYYAGLVPEQQALIDKWLDAICAEVRLRGQQMGRLSAIELMVAMAEHAAWWKGVKHV